MFTSTKLLLVPEDPRQLHPADGEGEGQLQQPDQVRQGDEEHGQRRGPGPQGPVQRPDLKT